MTQRAAQDRLIQSALFASSHQLMARLQFSVLVTAAGLGFGQYAWPLVWFVIFVLGASLEALVRRARTRPGRFDGAQWQTRLRIGLALFNSTMYSIATIILTRDDGRLEVAFSLVVIFMTMLYMLMYYYMHPKLLAVLITPCAIALVDIGAKLSFGEISGGRPIAALVPILGAVVIVQFFITARFQLARARSKLVAARSEALQHAAEAHASSQAKSEFLAIMSHEIRTPLNGVLGMAQVMSRDALSDLQRDRVEVIRESGESLLAILNDVLDISKIEAGKLELEAIEFSLSQVGRGAHAAFTSLANAKGLSFNLTIEPLARGVYLGDSTRLRQILYNLIANAVKFTEEGEVRVAISRQDDQVRLSVRDTGIGIAPERRLALFEKFVQADASTTRRYGGTGLGLAITSELVQLMGGALELDSAPGEGSTFTAVLPLAWVGPDVERQPQAAPLPTAEPATGDSLRVLAAEDNSINQLVLKTMLHQAGVDPHLVSNGLEAVQAWEVQDWDVILMDVQMPEMDGETATRIIRRREAEIGRPRTPIIALTANAMAHHQARYLGCGMDYLVAKPIEAARLLEALELAQAGRGGTSDDEALDLQGLAPGA